MMAFIKALFGIVVVALIGVAALTIDAAPGSTAAAEAILNERVSDAFGIDAREWAQFEIDGQKVILTGEAPSEAARQALLARVASSDWRGGLLFGGVTAIDDSGLTVAPPQPASEPPVIIAETPTDSVELEEAPTTQAEDEEAAALNETELSATVDEPEEPEEPDCIDRLQSAIDSRRIGFESASADIDNLSRTQLRDIAAIFVNCPRTRLQITGHTDDSGNARRNLQLSERRADAVHAFLTSAGAQTDRLTAQGVGSSEPQVSNDTPEGREQNRRIEIEVIIDDE